MPILIMDAAKAEKKAFWLAEKVLTYAIVVECVGHGHVEIDESGR